MMENLSNPESIDALNELDNLSDKWIVMVETSAEKMVGNSLSIIKHLIDNGSVGIILSASRPYNNLLNLYEKNGIDTSKILFIDCISKSQKIDLAQQGNVIYHNAVSDLTNISLSIRKTLDKIPGEKFVFIDSITTMLIHNNPEIFTRFVHGMITKLRLEGVSGFLISIEEESDNMIRSSIAELCDKVINI